MVFRFAPLSHADVAVMRTWRYEEPYEEYDPAVDDPPELDGAPDMTWLAASLEGDDDLAGFVMCRADGEAVEIGLGLRPDLTGRGLGVSFIDAIMAEVRSRRDPTAIWLDVFPWNARAITVYERCGFVRGQEYLRRFEGGVERTFLRMTYAGS
jgi:ribosomal-protein-alanine N-acetyltransferase